MIEKLFKQLNQSKTAYHAVDCAAAELEAAGFTRLDESSKWNLSKHGKYYVVRDGSALVAFRIGGEQYSYAIAASHTDSPCFKIKLNCETPSAGCMRACVERYGGGLLYSWLDTPLNLAGRVVCESDGVITAKNVVLDELFVIPSLAIHLNRSANDGLKLNPQVDMQILSALGGEAKLTAALEQKTGAKVLDYDLYAVCAEKPFIFGFDGAFACAPRVDNLASAFASVNAIIDCQPNSIPVIYLADNEEVGSRTKQGAGSTLLKDVITRINLALSKTEEELAVALSKSFMASCDNSHATHPNHPELSDPANKTPLGSGVVIKHHANQNYTTDAMSSAIVKHLFDKAGVKHADFFMRSDLPCGGTLGAISSSQLSIRSVDIGMPQLAMHSSRETFAVSDYAEYVSGITAILSAGFDSTAHDNVIIK